MNRSILYFIFVFFALSFADNAKNVTTNDIYCKSQNVLYNQILNCRKQDYCCSLNVYESQFNNEQTKCTSIMSTFCNNLKNCRTSCKKKIPLYYNCIYGNTNEKYSLILNSCYKKCFDNEYNCPNSKNQQKYFGIGEIIIVVIVLGTFGLCVARYTCFKDCRLKNTRRSSKVHIATTNNNFSDV
jgi:hypothetical protein